MDFLKKQSVATWLIAVSIVLTVVSVIIYAVNCSGGYFKDATVQTTLTMALVALIAQVAAIGLAQVKAEGTTKNIIAAVTDLLKICAVIMLIGAALFFLEDRAEGLATLFFSNADVLATVQTPENMASAAGAIAAIVCFIVAWLISLVGSFLSEK